MVAEHLDHLHYLNDILLLDIKDLNAVLTEHLLHKLFIPLYIFSLIPAAPTPLKISATKKNLAEIQESVNPRISPEVALYLLSLVFLVVTHGPLVHALTWVILNANKKVFKEGAFKILNDFVERYAPTAPSFEEPIESLEEALNMVAINSIEYYGQEGISRMLTMDEIQVDPGSVEEHRSTFYDTREFEDTNINYLHTWVKRSNITDEEKHKLQMQQHLGSLDGVVVTSPFDSQRPFLEEILNALNTTESDYPALLALCLIHAINFNTGKYYIKYNYIIKFI